MFYIAHRGNIIGPNLEKENSPSFIDSAIDKGFYVEIDLWSENNQLFLGHDLPSYKIDSSWLFSRSSFLWVHCKNSNALNFCVSNPDLNYFFHNTDDYTLTSQGYVWIYPGKDPVKNGVCVLPEWNFNIPDIDIKYPILGVCSDYVQLLRK